MIGGGDYQGPGRSPDRADARLWRTPSWVNQAAVCMLRAWGPPSPVKLEASITSTGRLHMLWFGEVDKDRGGSTRWPLHLVRCARNIESDSSGKSEGLSGGSTIDTEARTALGQLLAAMRQHGLIAA